MSDVPTGQPALLNRMRALPFLLLVLAATSVWADTRPVVLQDHVLVLHSYHHGLDWTDSITAGIQEAFEGSGFELHFEYLDTKRISGAEYFLRLAEFEKQRTRLANITYKVMIASDNNALSFIQAYGDELYPGVPVVFCGVNNFDLSMIPDRSGFTGVAESIDYRDTLDLMHRLHPERRNTIIIVDKTVTGRAIRAEIEELLPDFAIGYTFEFYQEFLLKDVPDHVSSFGENDIILLLTFNQDSAGNFISYRDGIAMLREYAQVPIYGAWDFYFGDGIVGGRLTSGKNQGIAAARMALRILRGERPSDIPILLKSPNQYMFDYREMDRFDLDLDDLPRGSLVINRPESIIDRFGIYIRSILGLMVIIWVGFSIRFIQLRRKERQLRNMNIELERRVSEQTADLREKIQVIEEKNTVLEEANHQIRTLEGIIPICSCCKKVRNDEGYWNQVEQYVSERTDAVFTHGLCPDCFDRVKREVRKTAEPV